MDEFFTARHKRLDRIARAANIFAWVLLLFYGSMWILQMLLFLNQFTSLSFRDYLANNTWSVLLSAMRLLNPIWTAAFYWLVLKGIALGLNMLIETDLNYREQAEAVGHE